MNINDSKFNLPSLFELPEGPTLRLVSIPLLANDKSAIAKKKALIYFEEIIVDNHGPCPCLKMHRFKDSL